MNSIKTSGLSNAILSSTERVRDIWGENPNASLSRKLSKINYPVTYFGFLSSALHTIESMEKLGEKPEDCILRAVDYFGREKIPAIESIEDGIHFHGEILSLVHPTDYSMGPLGAWVAGMTRMDHHLLTFRLDKRPYTAFNYLPLLSLHHVFFGGYLGSSIICYYQWLRVLFGTDFPLASAMLYPLSQEFISWRLDQGDYYGIQYCPPRGPEGNASQNFQWKEQIRHMMMQVRKHEV